MQCAYDGTPGGTVTGWLDDLGLGEYGISSSCTESIVFDMGMEGESRVEDTQQACEISALLERLRLVIEAPRL